jgi:carboxylesterase type B
MNLLLFLVFVGFANFVNTQGQMSSSTGPIPGLADETVTVLLNQYEEHEFGYIGIVEHLQHDTIKPVAAFRGIPYAKPPIGDLRYKVS